MLAARASTGCSRCCRRPQHDVLPSPAVASTLMARSERQLSSSTKNAGPGRVYHQRPPIIPLSVQVRLGSRAAAFSKLGISRQAWPFRRSPAIANHADRRLHDSQDLGFTLGPLWPMKLRLLSRSSRMSLNFSTTASTRCRNFVPVRYQGANQRVSAFGE